MTMNKDQEPKILTLDVPQREGREGYIGTIFGLYLRFGGIIAETNFKEADIRIYYMTKFLMNLIPGEKTRKAIRERMNKEIEDACKNLVNNEDKIRARNDICLDYVGVIHDFVDKHLGVSTENRIGFVVKPAKEAMPEPARGE